MQNTHSVWSCTQVVCTVFSGRHAHNTFKNTGKIALVIKSDRAGNFRKRHGTAVQIGFDSRYEITDFIWDGTVWTCSAKASENEKTVFSYCTFQPKEPLYAITPENAGVR